MHISYRIYYDQLVASGGKTNICLPPLLPLLSKKVIKYNVATANKQYFKKPLQLKAWWNSHLINVHLSYYKIHVPYFCLIALLLPVCFEGSFQIMKHLPRVPVSKITLFAFMNFQNEWAVRGILKKIIVTSKVIICQSIDMTQIRWSVQMIPLRYGEPSLRTLGK